MRRDAIVRRQILALAEDALVYHQAPGDYDDTGRFVPGATVARNIRVVAQPMTEALAARVLPEGTRLTGQFRFYVLPTANVAPLRIGDMPTGRDIIRYSETNYRVSSVEPWGGYTVVFAIRLDNQETLPDGSPALVLSGGDVALSGQRVVS